MGADTIERSDSERRRRAAWALHGRLRDFGRRRKAVAGMRGALWMLALLAFGLLAVAWVDLLVDLPPLVRVAGMAAALLVGVGALTATVLVVRRAARPMQVARDVDRLAGSAGQVAAGLDLTEMPARTRALTKALAGMAVGRAVELVKTFPEDAVGPLRSVGDATKGVVAALCAVVAFAALGPRAFDTEVSRLVDPWGDHPAYSRYAFTVRPGDAQVLYGAGVAVEADVKGPPLERLNLVVRQPNGAEEALPMFSERSGSWRVHLTGVGEPLTYWVSAGRARSARYHVSVITTPQIEQFTVRTEPPAYTNLPPVEGAMPDGGISGLPGTRVELTARSNRPLASGQVRLDLADGTQRPLIASPLAGDPKSVSLDFTIEQAGQLSLWVVDEGGERSAAEIRAPILLLKDERPFVRILEPRPESFATPDVPLPVMLDAEDDYGVSALSVYRALNGSRHLPEKLMVPLPAGRKLDRTSYLTLADYGLEAGDLITLFGRVEDTDPAGAKGSESAVVRVNIISRELYDELTRAQQTAEEFQKKYDEAARRLEALQAAADALSKQLEAEKAEQGDKVSKEMQEKLAEFAEQAKEAAEATQQAADQEPLYALDQDLSEALSKLADAMASAGEEASKAARAARAGSRTQTVESLELARAMLGAGQTDYAEAVQEPLERFMKAYALLEMQERFVALADKQRDLAERAAELKGRDGTDDPALKARMRDLRDEERANQEELNTILQEIRNRAAALPDDEEFAELKDTAIQFADAVEASRAAPALAESGDALDAFHGTEATERATEAADVLEDFIRKAGGSSASMDQVKLAFGPKRSQAAGMTAQQLLAAAGLGKGQGLGRGSGAGGYSTRTGTMDNVGLYGPARRGGAGGRENMRDRAGGVSGESVGGSGVGGITLGPGASGASEALPLQALPPRHREGVRAYFRSVAEETSAGRVAEPPAARSNREPQTERGTR